MMKFGIVGLSGMAIDFLTTWICKEKFLINKYLANSIGFSLAVINNFFWNSKWTFGTSYQTGTNFIKFILFALIGLLLNNLLLFLFHSKFRIRFYIAKGFAIVCVFAWNFLTNYFFNFHS
ncbi:MAG: GtrA family protein [Bacteroidota bacterium]|nr:GtrA family protein [Bacteroidota bacterium]